MEALEKYCAKCRQLKTNDFTNFQKETKSGNTSSVCRVCRNRQAEVRRLRWAEIGKQMNNGIFEVMPSKINFVWETKEDRNTCLLDLEILMNSWSYEECLQEL